ncbi:cell division protein FtsQ/DivIB [Salibacterium halotolerans]|uniref:Cell division protein DivIB n=1 Tax=Salibacterium halotolerans TaxID=1884432 RepID=A0A1I5M565_9BACI|nr:cell division protein FtsQ/DivIB [Salibacterium halotolerans]SFP04650.1 cell division protein FtsQ [Salibacterium halotolerans]
MTDKKVIPAEEKIPALKEKRKKRTNRRLVTYLSVFFLLILLVVYFQSPLSHIRHIKVEGNIHTAQDNIKDRIDLQTGDGLWTADLTQAEQAVQSYQEIENVSVTRSFPSTVTIHVQEYRRMAYVENGGSFVPVLQNGEVLSEKTYNELPSDAPILRNFEDRDKLAAFSEEMSQLGEGVMNRISEVMYAPSDDDANRLRLYMNDGIEVESTIENFASHMADYPSVARQINPDADGVLHMKINSYFKADQPDTAEGGEERSEEE